MNFVLRLDQSASNTTSLGPTEHDSKSPVKTFYDTKGGEEFSYLRNLRNEIQDDNKHNSMKNTFDMDAKQFLSIK